MKLSRIALALVVLVTLVGLAAVAQRLEPAGSKMALAAEKLLGSLTAEQKAKAAFTFDSPERTRWFFVPLQDAKRQPTRKGLPLEEMTAEQKKLALTLVQAGTSETGHKQAVAVMNLEAILREQEKSGAMVRNPEWYFFTIFGNPSKSGKWGWRVEGHHLSLNYTLDGGEVIAATPSFFGANPAEVKSGKNKGLRVLEPAETLAFKLFKSLDDEQKKIAHRDKAFPEIEQAKTKPNVGQPQGLPAAKMTDAQRGLLMELVEVYTKRLPSDIAEREMKAVKAGGLDKIHFAYTGAAEFGQKHTYRIQSPTFVVEFINEQNDSAGNVANHIHSALRRVKGDFGTE
jgi:hypothetical protein